MATNQYFMGAAPIPYFFESDFLAPAGELPNLSPSQLLSVGNRAIPFSSRQDDLAGLLRWRDDAPRRSVYLLYGPGGQGKTRLADHFFTRSRQAGWQVSAVRHVSETPYPSSTVTGPGPAGRRSLVVVDYADRWPADDLLRLLSDAQWDGAEHARLLLVARSPDWWLPLRHRLAKQGWERREQRLDPVARPDNRVHAFRQARERFAAILNLPCDDSADVAGSLRAPQYDLILSVHMAALASVLGSAPDAPAPPSDDPIQISAYLLDRERSYWDSLRSVGRIHTQTTTIARAVIGAVLAGPLPHPGGVGLLECARICSMLEPATVILDDHKACYPAADPAHVLQPLYPDRLAEDFLALQIPGMRQPARADGDPGVDSILENLLSPTSNLPEEVVARIIVVLAETARRWEHVADRHFYPAVSARRDLGFGFSPR